MPAWSALRARSRRRARETSLATVVDSSFRLVIAGSAVVVLTVGLLLVWLTASSSGTVQRYENALAATQSAHTALLNQESSLRGFVSTNDLSFVASYNKARGDMELANAQLLKTDGDGELTKALIDLRLAQQRWVSEWAQVAAGGLAPGTVGSPERLSFLLRDKVLFDQYGDARADAAALITEQLAHARHQQVVALSLVAGASMATGLGILVVALRRRRRLRRDVLAPVNAVLDGLEAAADGRYDEPVRTQGARELIDVVDGLNRMTARLASAREAAARREEHISAQSEQLRSILAMVREIGGSLNLDYVVVSVVGGVGRIVGADRVAVWLTSPDGGSLVESLASGAPGSATRPPVALGSGPIGRAAKYSRLVTDLGDAGQRLAVPLVVGSRVVGVLDLELDDVTPLVDASIEVLETLAVHAATALEAARLHEDAAHASEHDALTQLPNRRRLDADLAVECERSARYARPLAFVMLDLDHFKRVNDRYGHARGDEVLQAVADVLGANLRASDTAYRYGGEELAVILRESNLASALEVAERLRARIESVFAVEGEIPVTASFDVAELGPQTSMPASLVAAADAALYAAKHEGRNRVCADRESSAA
ncbi:diguanylate cyclase [Angustibacter sp. McL0619]|uniref:sensor domain-containing diguanylate cyclase n=1 Tax=Angustibacter sp. McL0619 TaxID=3415676 RepID=UPI003CEEC03C